jgi:hypothetical protein
MIFLLYYGIQSSGNERALNRIMFFFTAVYNNIVWIFLLPPHKDCLFKHDSSKTKGSKRVKLIMRVGLQL